MGKSWKSMGQEGKMSDKNDVPERIFIFKNAIYVWKTLRTKSAQYVDEEEYEYTLTSLADKREQELQDRIKELEAEIENDTTWRMRNYD